jgi:C4-dicarboxylate-specific signal transduction histidine kinase
MRRTREQIRHCNRVFQEALSQPSARSHLGGARARVERPGAAACDNAPRRHEPQTELASANQVAMLWRLSASIAEINQPICAVVMNAEAALRLPLAQPIDTEAVRRLLACIVKDGMRSGDLVSRTRALIKKPPPRRDCQEINALTLMALDLANDDLVANSVSVRMKLAKDLPRVQGDRVQLLQVIVNLIINAIGAIDPHAAASRDLLIRTAKTRSGGVLFAVCDSSLGADPANLECIFDAFLATKADGSGLGLSICRAIIQAHGGRLSATKGGAHGTILQFILPAHTGRASELGVIRESRKLMPLTVGLILEHAGEGLRCGQGWRVGEIVTAAAHSGLSTFAD